MKYLKYYLQNLKFNMKIKTPSGKEIDTDKLNDRESEVAEALFDLYSKCEKYNVTMFARLIFDNKKFLTSQFFKINKRKKKRDFEEQLFLMDLLAQFVSEATDGTFKVMPTKDLDA